MNIFLHKYKTKSKEHFLWYFLFNTFSDWLKFMIFNKFLINFNQLYNECERECQEKVFVALCIRQKET